MVPLRSSRSRSQAFTDNSATSRTRPGHADHDVFEGLPVRRWTRQRTAVSQKPKSESLEGSLLASQKLPELPMPRDSHLLTPMSRALLRAARAGCTYMRRVPKAQDEEEREVKDEEGGGGGESSAPVYERTFLSSKWGAIPRHLEPPEVEFLAKRRTGPSDVIGNGAVQTPSQPAPLRKTKFKKLDTATGTMVVYEAWVPEGHKVEGEMIENEEVKEEPGSVVTAAPAPGTVVEGVGIVDEEGVVVAEPEASMVSRKRQPPPQKRKAKGVGRGRKKKVMFAPGEGVAVSQAEDTTAETPGAGQEEDGEEDEEESGDEVDTKSPATANTPAATEPEQTPQEEVKTESGSQGPATPTRNQSSSPDIPLAGLNRDVGASASAEPQPIPAPVETPTQEQPELDLSQGAHPETQDSTQTPPIEAPPTADTTGATAAPSASDPVPTTTTATDTTPTPAAQASPPEVEPTDTAQTQVTFEDGEVDLLGSLEASLDRHTDPPPASHGDMEEEEEEDKPTSGSGGNSEPAGDNDEPAES